MTYLLDTHTFLWFIDDDSALTATAKELIGNAENVVYLSIASLWEMVIKISPGKLEVPSPFLDFVEAQLLQNNIILVEIKAEHIGVVATLPFHHRDPFDRLIIAQSQSEDFPVIGRDEVFDEYGISRHW